MAGQHDKGVSGLDHQVRHSVFRYFMENGSAPSAGDIAESLAVEPLEIEKSFQRLEAKHAMVLAPSTSNIWMCHPFSAVPTPFRVRTAERDYWANCGWDTLGISAVLGVDTESDVKCQDCGTMLTVNIKDGSLVGTEGVVHFVVPPKQFWDNVGFT